MDLKRVDRPIQELIARGRNIFSYLLYPYIVCLSYLDIYIYIYTYR